MKKILSVILSSFLVALLHAQSLEELKLDNKQSILNDKAFFYFPKAAVNEARAVDIMSADHNINEETRIVFDQGDMRLVFFAQELYLLGNERLFEEVSGQVNENYKFNNKILTRKDDLLSVLSTPTVFDSTSGAILINSLLVKMQDNAIFRIDAYINPAAYSKKNEFTGLTEKVFSTLQKGKRTNKRNARQETMEIFGSDKKFRFELPENYGVTVNQKYDFQVFYFHKYQDFADTNWVSVTIYTGHHPSFFYTSNFRRDQATEIAGEFLGQKVSWLSFADKEKGIYLKEQQIKADEIDFGLIVHVVMRSNRELSMDELTKIIEAVKLK